MQQQCQIYFMRHAQSKANIGLTTEANSPLSLAGQQQAMNLTGDYDLVLTSPLRRAIQTLAFSSITYRKHMICADCREIRDSCIGDYLEEEVREEDRRAEGEDHGAEGEKPDHKVTETDQDVLTRIKSLRKLLDQLAQSGQYRKILVISHACFTIRFLGLQRCLHNCEIIKWK